jgi:uncharacterized protein YndB with AHSA1/START domain
MKAFETSREIPATIEQVFAAFCDPNRLARWWGPAGFTNTFQTCEIKTGGKWCFVMRGPDGKDYKNESVFAEIDAPHKIVIQHKNGPKYELTILLTQRGERTVVDWSQVFESADVAKRIESIVVPSNEQNLDRWTEEVLRVVKTN